MTSAYRSSYREKRAQLYDFWTRQLYREYDYVLFLYGLKLPPPIIRVEYLKGRWGHFEPVTRTITISAKLIQEHSWDVVIEILKHEMAHQYVADRMTPGRAHGERFKFACNVLRVADWAATATGEIPEELSSWHPRAVTEEEERLLRRAEKLLSLASSANEHEALLAMQRVQELYARHNLARLKARQEASMVTVTISLRKKRIERNVSMACSILMRHFFVRIIYGRLYEAKDNTVYRSVELIGSRENVSMAEYVYHFLWSKSESLWDEYRRRTGTAGKARRDYILGVLSGFEKKLSEGKKTVMASAAKGVTEGDRECTALVAMGDQELEDYVDERYPRLKSRSWSATYRDAESFAAGEEEGRNIVIRKGIKEGSKNRGRLLSDG